MLEEYDLIESRFAKSPLGKLRMEYRLKNLEVWSALLFAFSHDFKKNFKVKISEVSSIIRAKEKELQGSKIWWLIYQINPKICFGPFKGRRIKDICLMKTKLEKVEEALVMDQQGIITGIKVLPKGTTVTWFNSKRFDKFIKLILDGKICMTCLMEHAEMWLVHREWNIKGEVLKCSNPKHEGEVHILKI